MCIDRAALGASVRAVSEPGSTIFLVALMLAAAVKPSLTVTPTTEKSQRRAQRRLLLSIEGNIGIGKSTLMNRLREQYASSPRVAFVDEPVATWEEHGLLAAMYENRISRCTFQLMALSTRYAGLLAALDSDADVIIAERSIESDRACFAEVNLDRAEDREAYAVAHDALRNALPKDLLLSTILLDAPRSVLMQRIAKRGRAEEKLEKLNADEEDPVAAGGVPEEYLAKLDEAHEALYSKTDPSVRRRIDATQSADAVATAVLTCIDELCEAQHTLPAPVKSMEMASSPTSIMSSDAVMVDAS